MAIAHVALFSSLVVGAIGHGVVTLPMPRQGGSLSTAVVLGNSSDCAWFSNKVEIPGEPTMCDPVMTGFDYRCGSATDPDKKRPWRAPGTAPILSPCGVCAGAFKEDTALGCGSGDAPPRFTDAADLPARTPRAIWQRGATAQAAWAIQANHLGGYAWRLCPANEPLTEHCFQRNYLQFAGDTSIIHWINGTEVTIPLIYTSEGTTPAGSQWARNPIPGNEGTPLFPAPCQDCMTCVCPCDPATTCEQTICKSGCHRLSLHNFSIIDTVKVPKSLPLGDYVLSWRWDCLGTPQVWSNCADITIVDDASERIV